MTTIHIVKILELSRIVGNSLILSLEVVDYFIPRLNSNRLIEFYK